jgi:3-deoxy-7-phosphoheptulonate synthase
MLVFMLRTCTREDLDRVVGVVQGLGRQARTIETEGGVAVVATGRRLAQPDACALAGLPGVDRVVPVEHPVARAWRAGRADARIRVGTHEIGCGFTIIAGPCAVEDPVLTLETARAVVRAGAHIFRGGAYKPRTSPYDFQGLGPPGLELLCRAREETGLPIVTEAVDEASLDLVLRHADAVQIGARNMQNFALLKLVGRSDKPVVLKRGLAATLDELLAAAEYVLAGGNPNVVLCERGIRTFADHGRFTLDLGIVPVLKRETHLPVIVDPSHAAGDRRNVPALARAALAAGADGVMVEVHVDPESALSDGPQSLTPAEFALLADDLRRLAGAMARCGENAK